MDFMRKCLVCQSSKSQLLYTSPDRMFPISGRFVYKQCISCGLAFLDPQPDKKTLRKHYPTKQYFAYDKEGKGGLIGKIREYLVKRTYTPTLLSRVLSFLLQTTFAVPENRKGGKILDIGCATGDMLALFKDLGWDVYGIDIDKKGIMMAKERGIKNLLVGTYKDVDNYPDNYFDCIRLYHVIEHVDDPLLCLKIIYKKLKPGGELYLSTPNFNTPIQKIFKTYWAALDAPRHLYLFTAQNLERLANKCRFSVVSVSYDSAHSFVGCFQYLLNYLTKRRGKFFRALPIVLFFYPCEWLLDRIKLGNTFTMRLVKK